MLVLRAIAFSAAVIMALAGAAQGKMERYEPKVILRLSWGDGPSDMGYAKDGPEDAEGLRYGPAAFDVDKDGSIYILDSVQRQIKVFAQTGKLLKSFPVELRGDGSFCLDEKGNVWLNDGNRYTVRKYTPDGTPILTIEYGPGPSRAVDRRITIRGGEIYLGVSKVEVGQAKPVTGKRGERIYKATRRPLSREEEPRFIGRTSKRRYKSQEVRTGPDKIIMRDENGNSEEIYFDDIGTRDTVVFQSEDRYGNIYVEVCFYRGRGKVYSRQIWKYSPDLNLLAKVGPIPISDYTEIQKDVVVTDDGDIYYMYTEKTGVKVVKWSARSE